MGEIAFQVHYQYLLSQIWLCEEKISRLVKYSKHVGVPATEIAELRKQIRDLESLYPDFYKNFKDTLDYRESLKKK